MEEVISNLGLLAGLLVILIWPVLLLCRLIKFIEGSLKPLPIEFERMNLEWRETGHYTDLNGNLRHDVDGIIDAWLELRAKKDSCETMKEVV